MQKRILYLLVLPLLVSLCSCSKDGGETNIDLHIDLSVLDQKGSDLLNFNSDNAMDLSQIKVFYKEEGQFIEAYKSKYPQQGYFLIPPNIVYDTYSLRLFVSSSIEYEDKSVTMIKWNDYESDTIITQIHKAENSEVGIEYWINGKTPDWIDRGRKIAKIVKTRE